LIESENLPINEKETVKTKTKPPGSSRTTVVLIALILWAGLVYAGFSLVKVYLDRQITNIQQTNAMNVQTLENRIENLTDELEEMNHALRETDDTLSSSGETQELLNERIEELDERLEELSESLQILKEAPDAPH